MQVSSKVWKTYEIHFHYIMAREKNLNIALRFIICHTNILNAIKRLSESVFNMKYYRIKYNPRHGYSI